MEVGLKLPQLQHRPLPVDLRRGKSQPRAEVGPVMLFTLQEAGKASSPPSELRPTKDGDNSQLRPVPTRATGRPLLTRTLPWKKELTRASSGPAWSSHARGT